MNGTDTIEQATVQQGRPRRRRPRWSRLAALALVGGGLAVDRSGLGAIVALFVVVTPFERLFPRHRQRFRRRGLVTDLAHAVVSGPLSIVATVVAAAGSLLTLGWLPGLAARPLVTSLPATAQVLLGAVLFDLVVYWAHRLSHTVPALWRFHAVHHSSRQLDWISGVRGHPLDGLIAAPAVVVLAIAGFPLEVTGGLVVLQLVIGLFLHANVRWRLRPLQRIVATPEFHHWHHADDPAAHHTNYAALLPVWDLAFRTYRVPADRRPSVYGVSEPVPDDLVGQLLHPFGTRNSDAVGAPGAQHAPTQG